MSNIHLIVSTPALRVRAENANHHLWNNHGTWFLHYTTYPTPLTKERIRRSLGTRDLTVARERRDRFFAHLSAEAVGQAGERCPIDDMGRRPTFRRHKTK